jgi:hypothetical protein
MPRFAGAPAAGVGSRKWSLGVSTMRNGEIVFVVYCLAAAAWIAWKTWR